MSIYSSLHTRISGCARTSLFIGLVFGSMQPSFAQQQATPAAASDPKEENLRQSAARTLNSLGVAYFEKQQFAKAIATFEDALKYDPGNQDMRTNLGMVYFQQG